MTWRILADTILVIHLAFIVFVALGGLLVVKHKWTAWLHLPAAVWGALIEFYGWYCPLTPLENRLRLRGGEEGYTGGFIEHYIVPIIYPGPLTREIQIALGLSVVVINILFYTWAWRRHRRAEGRDSQ